MSSTRKFVGPWQLSSKIGSGSFATVYKARHKEREHEVVAIKMVSREKLTKKLEENLEHEIRIVRTLQHPHIVAFKDIQKTDRHYYLVLEYCSGGDLSRLIKKKGPLPEPLAQKYLRQLAAGLQFLRARNLVHRDLKPQNLLLSDATDEAIIKIADFGFARHMQPQSMAETICGSPLYMAPEIFKTHKYDAKADLWSVGAIAFEMLTGRPPFTGANHVQLLENIERQEVRFPDNIPLSAECKYLLVHLLKRNPQERMSFEEFFAHSFIDLPPLQEDERALADAAVLHGSHSPPLQPSAPAFSSSPPPLLSSTSASQSPFPVAASEAVGLPAIAEEPSGSKLQSADAQPASSSPPVAPIPSASSPTVSSIPAAAPSSAQQPSAIRKDSSSPPFSSVSSIPMSSSPAPALGPVHYPSTGVLPQFATSVSPLPPFPAVAPVFTPPEPVAQFSSSLSAQIANMNLYNNPSSQVPVNPFHPAASTAVSASGQLSSSPQLPVVSSVFMSPSSFSSPFAVPSGTAHSPPFAPVHGSQSSIAPAPASTTVGFVVDKDKGRRNSISHLGYSEGSPAPYPLSASVSSPQQLAGQYPVVSSIPLASSSQHGNRSSLLTREVQNMGRNSLPRVNPFKEPAGIGSSPSTPSPPQQSSFKSNTTSPILQPTDPSQLSPKPFTPPLTSLPHVPPLLDVLQLPPALIPTQSSFSANVPTTHKLAGDDAILKEGGGEYEAAFALQISSSPLVPQSSSIHNAAASGYVSPFSVNMGQPAALQSISPSSPSPLMNASATARPLFAASSVSPPLSAVSSPRLDPYSIVPPGSNALVALGAMPGSLLPLSSSSMGGAMSNSGPDFATSFTTSLPLSLEGHQLTSYPYLHQQRGLPLANLPLFNAAASACSSSSSSSSPSLTNPSPFSAHMNCCVEHCAFASIVASAVAASPLAPFTSSSSYEAKRGSLSEMKTDDPDALEDYVLVSNNPLALSACITSLTTRLSDPSNHALSFVESMHVRANAIAVLADRKAYEERQYGESFLLLCKALDIMQQALAINPSSAHSPSPNAHSSAPSSPSMPPVSDPSRPDVLLHLQQVLTASATRYTSLLEQAEHIKQSLPFFGKGDQEFANTVSAEKNIYDYALQLGKQAALEHSWGEYGKASSNCEQAILLLECLLLEPDLSEGDRRILKDQLEKFTNFAKESRSKS